MRSRSHAVRPEKFVDVSWKKRAVSSDVIGPCTSWKNPSRSTRTLVRSPLWRVVASNHP